MARKARIIEEEASYHVFAQINRQEYFLEEPKTKNMLKKAFQKAKQKYNFIIRNFCIMDNHFHLDIKPGKGESLSRIMQWIMSMFARWYNELKGQVGRVWRGRFKSRVIKTIEYAVRLFKYIANNPVRAGKVRDPEKYKYCGLFDIVNKNYSTLDPPEGEFQSFANTLLEKYNSPNIAVIAESEEIDHECGFYTQKPGRKIK